MSKFITYQVERKDYLLQECGYNINNPIRRTRVTAAGGILHIPIMEIAWFNCLGTKLQAFQAIALDLPHSAGNRRTIRHGLSHRDRRDRQH